MSTTHTPPVRARPRVRSTSPLAERRRELARAREAQAAALERAKAKNTDAAIRINAAIRRGVPVRYASSGFGVLDVLRVDVQHDGPWIAVPGMTYVCDLHWLQGEADACDRIVERLHALNVAPMPWTPIDRELGERGLADVTDRDRVTITDAGEGVIARAFRVK